MVNQNNKWTSVTEELDQKDIMRANKLIQMLEKDDAVDNIPAIEKEFDAIQSEWKNRIITADFLNKLYRALEALKFAKAHNEGLKITRSTLFYEMIESHNWTPVQELWAELDEAEEKHKKVPQQEIERIEDKYKKTMEYIITEIGVGYQGLIEREFERRIRILKKRLERGVTTDFSVWLRTARKQKGYTLQQLAEKAGLSLSYIHRFEKGQRTAPSVTLVVKLAKALDYDPTMVLSMIGQGGAAGDFQTTSSEPVELLELLGVTPLKVNGKKLGTTEKNMLLSVLDSVVNTEWDDEEMWTEGKDLFMKIVKLQKKLKSGGTKAKSKK